MPVVINGSTGISGTDGSASTPAVQGTDTNTGLFFPAADTIAFAEGGTEVMRIDSAGNVGVGTTTPAKKFVVSNAGAVGMEWSPTDYTGNMRQLAYNRSTTAYVALRTEASQHEFYIGGNERMLIDPSGNVGIGTSSPGNRLDLVSNSNTSQIRVKDGVGATAYYDFGRDGTDGFFGFFGAQTTFSGYKWSVNAGTEVMRITNAGNVGIGTSSPGARLHVFNASGNTQARVYTPNGTSASLEFSSDTYNFINAAGGGALGIQVGGTERGRFTSTGDFQFNSGYGSVATAFGCRAWVRFNGTGTIAINGSGNVSSIGDINVGLYRVNFASAMPDGNYSPQVSVGPDVNNGANGYVANFQLGSVDVYYILPGTAFYDNSNMQVAVFR